MDSQDGGWWNFVVVKTFKLIIFYRLTSFENGYVLYMDPQPRDSSKPDVQYQYRLNVIEDSSRKILKLTFDPGNLNIFKQFTSKQYVYNLNLDVNCS